MYLKAYTTAQTAKWMVFTLLKLLFTNMVATGSNELIVEVECQTQEQLLYILYTISDLEQVLVGAILEESC